MHISYLQGNIWESNLLDHLGGTGFGGFYNRSASLGKYIVI